MNDKHEIGKAEALCEGITVTPIGYGYGAYSIKITGIDHSEHTRPFEIRLSMDAIQQMSEIVLFLAEEAERYERREKQINCSHPSATDGVCCDCGAHESEFQNLRDILYRRRYPSY